MCCRDGGNVAGLNLYFKHKSYRLSFRSVFRSVLKVTEIEACVWISHRCLCIALGGFSVIILLLWFFYTQILECGLRSIGTSAGQMSALQWYMTFVITVMNRREGMETRTSKKVVGFFGASQFRFCFDRKSKIQTLSWNEPEVGMGRANSWWHGNQETILKFSTQPGFTCFLLAHYLNTSVEVRMYEFF